MPNPQNLKPVKNHQEAVERGSKGGKAKKGSQHLSTIIRDMAENLDWDKTTLSDKAVLKQRYGKNGFKAMCYVALSAAMSGDIRAMDWLAKYGYGTKIDITSGDEPLNIALVEFVNSAKPSSKKNTSKNS